MSTPSRMDPDLDAPLAAVPDPDLEPVTEVSLLDELREELARDAKKGDVVLSVPQREGWSVRYNADITNAQMSAWRKKSRTRDGDVDELNLSSLILINQARCVVKTSTQEDAHDLADRPLTFSSKAFQEMVGAVDARGCLRKWYGADAHIIATAMELTGESGYADAISKADDEVDPT